MELFALNEDVAALQTAVTELSGSARFMTVLALAWQLRQRNCEQSLMFAAEAESLLGGARLEDNERQRAMARLSLVRGEVNCLFADLDAAEAHAISAIASFAQLGDSAGAGDGQWLMASIWHDRGDTQRRNACLELATGAYRVSGDLRRVEASVARTLERAAFRDANAADKRLAELFDLGAEHVALVKTWLSSARAIVASFTGDPGNSITYFSQAHHAALESGQKCQAILTATNCADNFADLGDLDAALEWDERALVLARHTGWPSMVGNTLMQTGNVLRLLGRHVEAETVLREALGVLAALTGSRNYAITLGYLGELALDVGAPAKALEWFRLREERVIVLNEPDFVISNWRGQANALLRLAQPQEANAKARAALELAHKEASTGEQIKILRVCAELHQQYALAPPEGMTAPSAALHFLNEALAVGGAISGYTPGGELLDEVARAYAECGDYVAAYANAQAAAMARSSSRLVDARNRAIAMQVRQESERIRADAAHHRQLAETEARRASALQEASATLETLGLIGREITASLDADAVFATLYRHVNQLLDATSFGVYLIEPGSKQLRNAFAIEAGLPSPLLQMMQIPIDAPTSFTARCARQRQEVVIDITPDTPRLNRVPGTLDSLSLLFAPLLIGDRLLGVMTIQSIKAHAYRERERSIFRALCAYGAIALDNAGAYTRAENARQQADQALTELRRAQGQLVESEKMAALGALVAGVAHELNTPIGNAMLTASSLQEEVRSFMALGPEEVTSSALKQHLDLSADCADLLLRNINRAAQLVRSFKQVATDQTSEQRRLFLLADVIHELRVVMQPAFKQKTVGMKFDVPIGIEMDSFPGPLTQILINFINNALLHAFEGRDDGHLELVARVAPDERVEIVFSDDGCGMEADVVSRVFEPFFTTKLGHGGSGLGLHIAYNMATQTLGGTIAVDSTRGKGSRWVLNIPRIAR